MRAGETGDGRQPATSLGVRLLLLSAVCLSMMILDHKEFGHLIRVRQAFSVVVYPLQAAVDLPFTTWRWAKETFADRARLLDENARLRSEHLQYDARLQRMAALQMENNRLHAMLDSSYRVDDRLLIAEILAVDPDPYRQRFTVNRGLIDGVYAGQALLDADGIVGQIDRVEVLTAQALLITDADHGLPVFVNRTGLRTIATGTGDRSLLNLPYLTNSADIRVGDLLVSSGLGGVFPPGYPVGRVTVVLRRPEQSFATVLAAPTAGLDRGREVLLVWNVEDVESASPVLGRAEAGK